MKSQGRLANTANRKVADREKASTGNGRAAKTLQDSEKRYRRLFESAKDGILILDADTGEVVDVNPFLIRLLGYSYDEFCGKHLWEIGAFKDIAASKEAFKTLQEKEYIRYEDLPLETRDGQHVAVEFVSNVYLVENARVIQCNIRDISARKRADKALSESEQKTRTVLDNIGIGVALIGPKMEILELNRRMREWFPSIGPGQLSICTQPVNNLVCESSPTQMTLQDGLVHEITMQTSQTGGARDYRVLSSPVFDELGKVTGAIELIEDITEKLSLEHKLRQAQKMEAVGRLAGGVAHDFNNMLCVILGYAELGLGKVDSDHPLHADLKEIVKAAKYSAGITQQLLAFARKQTIVPVPLDLNRTVARMIEMLRRLIGEDIELVWLPEAGLGSIEMDPVQVDQILVNLAINARDAILDIGTIAIETGSATFDEADCLGHAGFVPGDYLMLAIGDDGCGMGKETLDKIFEPFFTSKELGEGTGLGLATVYGIVQQNNGFIDVSSEPGKGTTFRIYLPRYADPIVDSQLKQALEIPMGRGETVLLVEDESGILEVAKTMLEKLGYRVLAASTPQEALTLAEEYSNGIQLLITDIVMPEMNGRKLAERLYSLYPDMKKLFMSGYTADVIANRGVLEEGMNFLQKPFLFETFAAKVRGALGD
jgi:PAS domain S-box-containing protein